MLNPFVRKYCFTVLGLGLSFYSVLGQTLFHESRIEPRHENLIALEDTQLENFSEELDLLEAEDLEIIDDLDEENDTPPYLKDYYPTLDTAVVQQSANSAGAGAVQRVPGFVAPFGLVEVITNSSNDGKVEVVFELAVGEYHGVAAARLC